MERRKEKLLLTGLAVFFLILVARLFYIQILDSRYRISADNQSMSYHTLYPSRGIILDRNGTILVNNRPEYDIMLTPREWLGVEFDTVALETSLGLSREWVREQFAYYRKYRSRIGWKSVVFAKHVDVTSFNKFEELRYRFPGIWGVLHNAREYPVNAGGNLLGYCSEVDERYIRDHPGEYKSGDYAGKTGIEAAREKDLRGEKGYSIYLRSSSNRIMSRYEDGRMDKEAVAGKNVVTCIDAGLQEYGQRLMKGKVGAIVAIEPSSGEILSMVSSPSIDVKFLEDFGSHYNEIMANPHKPLFNRSVASSYPPGSVFKLVNGLIALQEGLISPSTRYPCEGGYVYGDKKLKCHNHFSPLNLNQAIQTSCNGYFCHVFKSVLDNPAYPSIYDRFDKWREYVTSFGFGKKLGSDFPSELQGNIPTTAFYDRMYRKRWNPNTVISLSIGQGEIGCTPLHIANLAAAIANRGYWFIPHIVKDSDGVTIDAKYRERNYTMVDSVNFEKIIQGMYLAVNDREGSGATAWRGAVKGLDICGKTGTAQNPHGDDHSVFICFAPREKPEIAVAVYIENGGFGADWAVPIASLIVEKYLRGEISRPELEEEMMRGNLLHKVKTGR